MTVCMYITFAVIGFIFMYSEFAKDRERWRLYKDAHPPLSDDEYLAKFYSEIDPDVCLKVRELVADAYGVDKAVIYPDTRFCGDLD